MVVDFAARVKGVQLPYEHKGITLDDYASHYDMDEEKTIAVAIDYLKTYLIEIPPQRTVAGDVVIAVYHKSGDHIFFGIDGGNGKVITVMIEGGTQVIKRQYYKIIKAFTWAQQHQ
jgi:hypothetical protein